MLATLSNLRARTRQKSRSVLCSTLFRREMKFKLPRPVISFSFDDFPNNAGTIGADILEKYNVHATYYVSMGLCDSEAPTGRIFKPETIKRVVNDGHEVGCHTFHHCHAWDTPQKEFIESTKRNQTAFQELFPNHNFETISYPISCPHPQIKRLISRSFLACRGGGQKINNGETDLNYLNAFFLEKSRDHFSDITSIIDENRKSNGWLIFATHDISDCPTRYGFTPNLFSLTIRHAIDSGAQIMPIAAALKYIQGCGPEHAG